MLDYLSKNHDAFKLLRDSPVIVQAFEDPFFEMVIRPVDLRWTELGISHSITGYSPITSAHYISSDSQLCLLIRNGYLPKNSFERKKLVREILAYVHDYLHNWTYRAFQALVPNAGLDSKEVSRNNIDYFTSVHLLTEAVACVGLDYWFLSKLNLKTSYADWFAPLTTHYREKNLAIFRRFKPDLNVQNPDYLQEVLDAYHSDSINGFNVEDINKNFLLKNWLVSEILASRSQRANIRLWLFSLAGIIPNKNDLDAAIQIPDAKFSEVSKEISLLLWKMMVKNEWVYLPPFERNCKWSYSKSSLPDYRLWNITGMPKPVNIQATPTIYAEENFWAYAQQLLTKYFFPDRSKDLFLKTLRNIINDCNLDELNSLVAEFEPLPEEDRAPVELLFLE